LSIPCRYVVASYDYFDYKQEILEVLSMINDIRDLEIFPMTALALRFYMAEKLKEPAIKMKEAGDREFARKYTTYLSDYLKFDDLSHWTENQIRYLGKVGFTIEPESVSKKDLYAQIAQGFAQKKSPHARLFPMTESDYQSFNHWMSVISSRAHSLTLSEWE